MITKELIDSTRTADNSSETSLNLGKMSAMVNWDIGAGGGTSTRDIYLYGRIKSNNNVVARGNTGGGTISANLLSDPNKIADFTSAWNSNGGVTGANDGFWAPDSTLTGDTLIALAANGISQNSTQVANVGSVVNNKVTFSVYVKQIAAATNKELDFNIYLYDAQSVTQEHVSIRVGLDVVNIKSFASVTTNGPIPYSINDFEIYDTGVSDWYKISFCMTDYKGTSPYARLRLYPRINGGNLTDTDAVVWGGSIVTGDSTAVFDPSEWVLIDSVENKDQGTSGFFTLDNIYPQVAVRTSGNSGTPASRIRVWATYNELVN